MSKAVLISIRPEWCSQIENGLKTIEIRKTRPKISTPFKCYIYCTSRVKPFEGGYIGLSKVIGEFICDRIIEAKSGSYSNIPVSESRVDPYDLMDYADEKTVYGWHISDLVIYDKPKDIRQFALVDKEAVKMCPHRVRVGQREAVAKHNGWIKGSYGCEKEHAWEVAYECCASCRWKPLNRPPQCWCYVQ